METLLTIRVETKNWTEGNHAWFDAKLKANSIIEIEWGDGKKSTMQTYNESSWCRVAHYYEKSEGKEDRYSISFIGEDPLALLAFVDGTWEMTVENVNFINCPALKYLHYTQLPETDFSNIPNIETLVINEYEGSNLSLIGLKDLNKLLCRSSKNLKILDLTKNDNVEELDISFSAIKNIKVSNNSKLRIVATDYTETNPKSLEWLQKTVERNGGQIQEEWLNEGFLSNGTFGEEI